MIPRLLLFVLFLTVVFVVGALLNVRQRRRAEERARKLAAARDAYLASLIGPRRLSRHAMRNLMRAVENG